MALSNRERVGRILEALKEGLGPFIMREYRQRYTANDYTNEMDMVLSTGAYPGLPDDAWSDDAALLAALDTHACLHLMWRRWNEVFQDKLGHVGRSYVSEMIEARNNWAHQSAFSNDEAYRVADTAARLLKMVSAAPEAARVDEIGRELLRQRFEAEAEKARKETVVQAETQITTPGRAQALARGGPAPSRRGQRALHPGRVRRRPLPGAGRHRRGRSTRTRSSSSAAPTSPRACWPCW